MRRILGIHSHFIGIFIISLSVLAYQILLTRIFSVTLHYHYAFACISMAMLGIALGAEKVYRNKQRFSGEHFAIEWAKAALGFSVSSVVLVFYFLYAPMLSLKPGIFSVLFSFSLVLFIIPFSYSGTCVTLTLTKSPFPIGRLYAADLLGASIGCLGIVGALFVLDPISLILLLAALCAFAAWLTAAEKPSRILSCAKMLALLLLAIGTTQSILYVTDNTHLKLVWAKSEKQDRIEYERWNVFSRIAVKDWSDQKPFGWGFGKDPASHIEQKGLSIDADAGTAITRFNGDMRPLSFLAEDIINICYHLRPIKQVAVIGVGGGRDIISALYFGATRITGIEINPAIIEAVTNKFGDFSGNFHKRPEVTLINAEARSWLTQSSQKFDLVQVSLIDTWAATAVGGLTLSENKLYTVEAWTEFLNKLTPDGMLTVSRWFNPESHRGEFYRLLGLAAESLKASGVSPSEVRSHIMAFNVKKVITVVVSKSAFSVSDIEHAKQVAKKHGFTVMVSPDYAWDENSRIIASGLADKAFYAALPFDVTPSTDDRPFFFYTMRLKDVFLKQAWSEIDPKNSSVVIVLALLVMTLVCMAYFIAQPLYLSAPLLPAKKMLPYIFYFSAIGLGFMLVEISQMQRLMIFLGHPVYGLSVVLFTLLLFGGIGSVTTRISDSHQLLLRPLLLLVCLCAFGWLTPPLMQAFRADGTLWRIILSIAVLAPTGFFMGTMFPTGMIASRNYKALQPSFWGINGAASVLASVLGMVISMEYGITTAYWSGVGCYAVCVFIVYCWRNEVIECLP